MVDELVQPHPKAIGTISAALDPNLSCLLTLDCGAGAGTGPLSVSHRVLYLVSSQEIFV